MEFAYEITCFLLGRGEVCASVGKTPACKALA